MTPGIDLRAVMGTAFWRPSSARLILATRPGRRRSSAPETAANRLAAAADWLGRAQDATTDGGVSAWYGLRSGWAPSYPETTGYSIPTFLALAQATGDEGHRDRARRCVDFLAGVQLANGAFPGGTLAARQPEPSVFNSGQIICGLTSWYRHSGDERALAMARSAAEWLVGIQDDDGAWRRHGYLAYPVTYTAFVACWLAELGVLIDDRPIQAAASRQVDWVLTQQDPGSGWFDRSGFSAADHDARRAVTHTLAYTLWGVLHAGIVLGRADAVAASRRASLSLADLVIRVGWLPGVIDAGWQGRASYACLTGNAQMALVWMRLSELEPDPRLGPAADRLIDLVGAAQSVGEPNPGIRGGIPGSDPVWGAYAPSSLPNWAAKFYIDALLAQQRRISDLGTTSEPLMPG